MIKINNSILLIITLFYCIKSSDIILFPTQYFYNNTLKNSKSSLLNNLYNANLYSNTIIGDPQYNIKTFFSLQNCYYSISPKLETLDNKNISDYYHINKSNTFKNISLLNKYYVLSKNDIAAKEKFIFNTYNLNNKANDKIIINDLDFILGVRTINILKNNTIDIYYLNIGLGIMYFQTEKYNLINLLKERKIINDYNWFILFEKVKRNEDDLYNLDDIINVKGKLILGCFPHEYNPQLFLKDNIISDYSWILNFKNIYYYKNNSKYNEGIERKDLPSSQCIAHIYINSFLIIAPIQYFQLIQNDFFNEYISKNICYHYTDNEIEGIYCDKSQNFTINNLKIFPTLYFEHKNLNYTFELNYKDLFIEKDNKYWFLMVVENGDVDEWFFGYIFLKKYQFSFNQDTKRISFYNQELSDKDENEIKNNYKNKINFVYIILIIISSIILIILGFLLGKFIYKNYNKKRRANELDDNYEYISENKKNIN